MDYLFAQDSVHQQFGLCSAGLFFCRSLLGPHPHVWSFVLFPGPPSPCIFSSSRRIAHVPLHGVIGRIMPPTTKSAHVLVSRTCEYIILSNKRDNADIRVGEKFEDTILLALKLEKEHWTKECRQSIEGGKYKETDSPPETPEGTRSVDTLTLIHWFWTSDLQNYMVNLCYFKLPNLC